ncbi:MAG: deoxyguanosinetriphosphate triphosphohydrolase [Planctomycetota bacterium]|jgi:dGTPase|nr:deoxyguanosinetriphosphate triphosphohydrolase [Planctomycetota bacterium]
MDPLAPRDDGMIPAAQRPERGSGRRHPEPEHAFRNPYQRDRDRIIHAASFRRLEYKTQVFVNGEGDNYRTRLTHTLEVAQITRTLARALHINEDLAEAVAMSHDLGHTPFGHAGERLLDKVLGECGYKEGFNHNTHGLRVVDFLEKRYAAFDGINLTFETREAFIRHAGRGRAQDSEFAPDDAPLLEVACTLLADDIAYLAHDIDDGLYSGMLREEDLQSLALWRRATESAPGYEAMSASLKRMEGVRRLINILAGDAIGCTAANIRSLGFFSPEAVRRGPETAAGFSDGMEEEKARLKAFLYRNFYRNPKLMTVMEIAQEKLRSLFMVYKAEPKKMPMEYREIADKQGIDRAAADYLAGMTDRFAREEFARHFGKC